MNGQGLPVRISDMIDIVAGRSAHGAHRGARLEPAGTGLCDGSSRKPVAQCAVGFAAGDLRQPAVIAAGLVSGEQQAQRGGPLKGLPERFVAVDGEVRGENGEVGPVPDALSENPRQISVSSVAYQHAARAPPMGWCTI